MTGRGGYTMIEMMFVMALVSILAALAVPRLEAMLARQRTRGALNLFAADLHHTRTLAVRSGRGAVLRLLPSDDCPAAAPARAGGHAYRVVVRGDPERVVRTRSVRLDGARVCLLANSSDTVAFNSRGLLVPFANRYVWGVRGDVRDSLSLSVVGRVYRRF